MKLTRKSWIQLLRAVLKLDASSDATLIMNDDVIKVHNSNYHVTLQYPNNERIQVGSINAILLLRALSPLIENIISINTYKNQLNIKEDNIHISVPFDLKRQEFNVRDTNTLGSVMIKDLGTALKVLRSSMGGVKSSGLSEFLFWEGNRIYAFNGAALAYYETLQCPVKRILFPRNITDFLIELIPVGQFGTVSVGGDGIITCDFGDIGSISFTHPTDQPQINWKELIPEVDTNFGFMPIPAVLFRLPQIVTTLADRYHSRILMEWINKEIKITSGENTPLAFKLEDRMPYNATRKGYLDIVTLSPILSWAQEMSWSNKALTFRSNSFTFHVMLETP